MSADKRTVTTDALETLGTIISENEKRDAIHLAVDNAIAAHTLRPGEDVGFLPDGTAGTCEKPLGIVDPFLKNAVKKGERFWLVVYPRKITSLRHVWEHPDFQMAEDKPIKPSLDLRKNSIEWLQAEASKLGVYDYEELLVHAEYYLMDKGNGGYGEYWSQGDRFEGESIPDEFWDHYEIVTGKYAPKEHRGSFLSCAC